MQNISVRSLLGMIALTLMPVGFASRGSAAETAEEASVGRTDMQYHLGSGDKLRIIVFGEDTLGGEFVVGGTGRVALPLIGEVDAAGLSPSQLQDRIAKALADGYLNDPRVNVEVLNYRPFYILGEVNKPGEYPYANGLTVLNAVATAQGFTYRANTHKILIRHVDGTTEEKTRLTPETSIRPGDTVRVQERWF